MKSKELMDLIAQGENLTVEFKSDIKPLSDRELVATVMNLSNTEGGDFLLGVEDDGSIRGCMPITLISWELLLWSQIKQILLYQLR